MTDVLVIRHPQTTWNVAERYQGRLEAGLSVEGRRQVCLTGEAFRREPVDAIYSSPLVRAFDLARAISDASRTPVIVDQRLTEIAMGAWEGLYRAEIQERFPEMFEEWYVRPDRVRFPCGEDLQDVSNRAESVLSDVFLRHPGERVCVVTHSAVVQVLVAKALSLDLRFTHRVQIANASISTLRGDHTPGLLVSLNVTDHLRPAGMSREAPQRGQRKAS